MLPSFEFTPELQRTLNDMQWETRVEYRTQKGFTVILEVEDGDVLVQKCLNMVAVVFVPKTCHQEDVLHVVVDNKWVSLEDTAMEPHAHPCAHPRIWKRVWTPGIRPPRRDILIRVVDMDGRRPPGWTLVQCVVSGPSLLSRDPPQTAPLQALLDNLPPGTDVRPLFMEDCPEEADQPDTYLPAVFDTISWPLDGPEGVFCVEKVPLVRVTPTLSRTVHHFPGGCVRGRHAFFTVGCMHTLPGMPVQPVVFHTCTAPKP